MTIKTQTVKMPAATRTESETFCDLCETRLGHDWDSEYDVVKIEHERGSRYSGSGNAETVQVDCCPACFESKVVPALLAIGFTPRREEWDW